MGLVWGCAWWPLVIESMGFGISWVQVVALLLAAYVVCPWANHLTSLVSVSRCVK